MKVFGNKIYEKNFKNNWGGKYPSEEVIRFCYYVKNIINRKLIGLDIGCGRGACTWFMAKEGILVTAFDGAPSGLNKVNTLAKNFGINKKIETIHGDITKPLKYINKKYDLMIDSYSLYSNINNHVIRGFEEYFQILKPKGFFLNCCFGKKTSGFIKGKKINNNSCTVSKGKLNTGGLQSFYTKNELFSIYKNIGYKIIYYENILENRDGDFVEKHITYLTK